MAGCAVGGGGSVSFAMHATLLFSLLFIAAEAQTDAREPPQIKKPTTSSVRYERDFSEVILECEASGRPSPQYKWFWNSAQIDSSKNPAVTYDAKNGTLKIMPLTVEREGFYYCEASNSFPGGHTAIARSPSIQVVVGRVGQWTVDSTVLDVSFSEYSYAFLNCDDPLPSVYGPTSFKWYTVRTEGNTDQEALVEDSRRFIDSTGTLHFSYVLQSDQLGDGMSYACALSNPVQGSIRVGRRVKLTVNSGEYKSRKPVLEYPIGSKTYESKLNEVAQLECFMSGFEDDNGTPVLPQISWKTGGNSITSAGRFSIEENTRVLKISDLVEGDEGEYTCSTSTKIGTATGNLILNVTSAPIWLQGLKSKTVTEDKDAVFLCETRSASGENQPNTPRWEVNGYQLVGSQKYKLENEGRRLTVVSVKKKDDVACFQCYVDNSVGEVFSDACLNVILPIRLTTTPEPDQTVKQGDMVNLTVTATGDPLYRLSYDWFFKNETIKDPLAPPFVNYDVDTRVAYINTTDLSDNEMSEIAGVYQRIIYNTLQREIVEVEVHFANEPVVVPVAEAGFDYWIIGLIIGILIIIIILIICCVVCRRKMLEGDYPLDRKETAAGLDPEKELKDSGFHDLSRADYDFLPEKKSPNLDFDENIPLGDDESFGSEYGGEEATAFNEDGSFIGIYAKGDKKGGPPGYQAAESNV